MPQRHIFWDWGTEGTRLPLLVLSLVGWLWCRAPLAGWGSLGRRALASVQGVLLHVQAVLGWGRGSAYSCGGGATEVLCQEVAGLGQQEPQWAVTPSLPDRALQDWRGLLDSCPPEGARSSPLLGILPGKGQVT